MVDKFAERMQRVGRLARNALVGVGALVALAVRSAGIQEKAEIELAAALESTGQERENNIAMLKRQAAALQSVTTFGDELILSIQAQATLLGVTADKLGDVTKMAIGLSKVTGQDLAMSLRAAVLANQGEFTILQRYLPALRNAKTATEKLAIVTEAGARGFKVAQEEAETFSGTFAQLKNAIGDTAEAIGDAFLPQLKSLLKAIKAVIPTIQVWVGVNKQAIVNTVKWVTGILALTYALSKLAAAVKGLFALGTALKVSMLGPLGLITIAAVAAAAGLSHLWTEGRSTQGMLEKLGVAFRDTTAEIEAFNHANQLASPDAWRDLTDQAAAAFSQFTKLRAESERLTMTEEDRIANAKEQIAALHRHIKLQREALSIFREGFNFGDRLEDFNRSAESTKAVIAELVNFIRIAQKGAGAFDFDPDLTKRLAEEKKLRTELNRDIFEFTASPFKQAVAKITDEAKELAAQIRELFGGDMAARKIAAVTREANQKLADLLQDPSRQPEIMVQPRFVGLVDAFRDLQTQILGGNKQDKRDHTNEAQLREQREMVKLGRQQVTQLNVIREKLQPGLAQ